MKKEFMMKAIEISKSGMENNEGGPFGAVIVKDGVVIAEGNNRVTSDNDPTAHGEIVALRRACKKLGTFDLSGCEIYTSCEPCPMCLAAIYWAKIRKMYYGNTREDAAAIGFDDNFIYSEMNLSVGERSLEAERLCEKDAHEVFDRWVKKEDKAMY